MTRLIVLSLLTITIMLAGCGSDDDAVDPATPTATEETASPAANAPGENVSIDVRGFGYTPETLEVAVGTTITWTNADQILHTVTSGSPDSPDGMIDGQMPEAGATASHTFDTAGTVAYFCSRHEFMRGEIIVR